MSISGRPEKGHIWAFINFLNNHLMTVICIDLLVEDIAHISRDVHVILRSGLDHINIVLILFNGAAVHPQLNLGDPNVVNDYLCLNVHF